MARIGSIYIGGSEGKTQTGEVFNSGIAFSLESDSKINKIFTFDNDWEVEVCQGNQNIVSRCKKNLTIEQILLTGFELCQKLLDLLSVEKQLEMNIKSPGDNYVLLFNNEGKTILRYVDTLDINVSISGVSLVQYDKDGNIIPQPPRPPVNWVPAFRYYRLSQSSRDLYEAYRNLFLGLESMLSIICPKARNEGEKKWLLRALNEINKKSSLSSLIPENPSDPVAYIIKTQYDSIRCKLFHAKINSILPYETLDPTIVSKAYERLLMVWRQIAKDYFGVNSEGGVMTYAGFKSIIDAGFKQLFVFCATADPSVPTKEDDAISPSGFPSFIFDENKYEGEIGPGRTLLTGVLSEALIQIDVIHKVCTQVDSKLISVSHIKDGIYPLGVNMFENYEILRLVNKSTPKAIF
jgi:hypothetical protein